MAAHVTPAAEQLLKQFLGRAQELTEAATPQVRGALCSSALQVARPRRGLLWRPGHTTGWHPSATIRQPAVLACPSARPPCRLSQRHTCC